MPPMRARCLKIWDVDEDNILNGCVPKTEVVTKCHLTHVAFARKAAACCLEGRCNMLLKLLNRTRVQ